MIEICIATAAADLAVANSIASRLERTAELYVRVEQISSPLNESWDAGLDSTGFLMLLSPDSVPARSDREVWGDLLDHLNKRSGPPIGSVLVRDCRFPPILRRNQFFEWSDPLVLRSLQAWAVALHTPVEPPGIIPATLPDAGPVPDYLWNLLVDGCGVASVPDVRVAQEFACRARRHFRDVIWVPIEGRSAEFVVSEFEAAMRVRKHRVIVVLHGTEVEPDDDPEAQGSVILVPAGRLEQAEHVSALWQAITACVGSCFPLDLALEIAGGGDPSELERAGLIDCIDRERALYRRRAFAPPSGRTKPIHAAAIAQRMSRWRKDPKPAERVAAEVESALEWSLANDWTLAVRLGRNAAEFFRHRTQFAEAGALLEVLIDEADRRNEMDLARDLGSELAWIRNDILPAARGVPSEQLTLDLQL